MAGVAAEPVERAPMIHSSSSSSSAGRTPRRPPPRRSPARELLGAASSSAPSSPSCRDRGPRACSLSLISCRLFLPKLRVLAISSSVLPGEVADRPDVGVAQAVARAHRQLQLLHRRVEQRADPLLVLVACPRRRRLRLVEVDEDREVVLGDLRRLRQGVVGRDRPVCPDLEDRACRSRSAARPACSRPRTSPSRTGENMASIGNRADHLDVLLVALRGHVPAAQVDLDLQLEVRLAPSAWRSGRSRVHDLDVGVDREVLARSAVRSPLTSSTTVFSSSSPAERAAAPASGC